MLSRPVVGYVAQQVDLKTYDVNLHFSLQALFLSPKNNVEGALAVLNAAKCDIWIRPHGQATLPLVEAFTKQKSMRILELPSLEELLDAETTEPFPFLKTFKEAVHEPFCITHTSGTTGVPKPISWTHGLIGSLDAVRLLPPTDGDHGLKPWTYNWNEGDTIYSSFPMSHVSNPFFSPYASLCWQHWSSD